MAVGAVLLTKIGSCKSAPVETTLKAGACPEVTDVRTIPKCLPKGSPQAAEFPLWVRNMNARGRSRVVQSSESWDTQQSVCVIKPRETTSSVRREPGAGSRRQKSLEESSSRSGSSE